VTYKMFIDDERDPPNGETDWVVCRDAEDVFVAVVRIGLPSFISFDHDLGDGATGYDIAKWIIDIDMVKECVDIPDDFSFYVHSQNPVGAENIRNLLSSYLAHRGNT